MKPGHLLIGSIIVLGGGYWFYFRKATTKTIVSQNALSGNIKGYSNLMNLSPKYYNTTSTEGTGTDQAENFSDAAMAASPWTLGSNGGNGSEINAGWTDWPDSYSAVVANDWQKQAVAGSHL